MTHENDYIGVSPEHQNRSGVDVPANSEQDIKFAAKHEHLEAPVEDVEGIVESAEGDVFAGDPGESVGSEGTLTIEGGETSTTTASGGTATLDLI